MGVAPNMTVNRRLDGCTILVVDDAVDALALFENILQHFGADVSVADSVDGAWSQLHKTKPDIIISDICMPDKDGFEFASELRKSGSIRHRQVPLIAISALEDETIKERCRVAGFDAHMEKPADFLQLVELVADLSRKDCRADTLGDSTYLQTTS